MTPTNVQSRTGSPQTLPATKEEKKKKKKTKKVHHRRRYVQKTGPPHIRKKNNTDGVEKSLERPVRLTFGKKSPTTRFSLEKRTLLKKKREKLHHPQKKKRYREREMTTTFGYHQRAKLFEKELLFHEPIEIIVRGNSRVNLQLETCVRVFRDSNEFCVTESTFFRVGSSFQHFRFEPSSSTKCVVSTFVRDDDSRMEEIEQELLVEGYEFVKFVASHYFLRSTEEIRPMLLNKSSISLIGSIPNGLVGEIQKCQNIKKLSLDLSVKYGDNILSAEIRDLIRQMPWLEHIHIVDTSSHHHHRTETLDFFEFLPKSVMLSGNLKLGRCLEQQWPHIERLETYDLCDLSSTVPSLAFFQKFTGLKSLTLILHDLSTMNLTTLSRTMTELTIRSPRIIDRRTCVDIGRLLRRNQLKKLNLHRLETVKKNELLYVLKPLLEGSNMSLEELDVTHTNLSTTLYFYLEDVINFCPTIRTMKGLYRSKSMYNASKRRNAYAAVKNPLQTLVATARPGSTFARALELTLEQIRTYMPTYRRLNRKWYLTGYQEVVSTPLEFC